MHEQRLITLYEDSLQVLTQDTQSPGSIYQQFKTSSLQENSIEHLNSVSSLFDIKLGSFVSFNKDKQLCYKENDDLFSWHSVLKHCLSIEKKIALLLNLAESLKTLEAKCVFPLLLVPQCIYFKKDTLAPYICNTVFINESNSPKAIASNKDFLYFCNQWADHLYHFLSTPTLKRYIPKDIQKSHQLSSPNQLLLFNFGLLIQALINQDKTTKDKQTKLRINALDTIYHKCIKRTFGQRYNSFTALIQDLKQAEKISDENPSFNLSDSDINPYYSASVYPDARLKEFNSLNQAILNAANHTSLVIVHSEKALGKTVFISESLKTIASYKQHLIAFSNLFGPQEKSWQCLYDLAEQALSKLLHNKAHSSKSIQQSWRALLKHSPQLQSLFPQFSKVKGSYSVFYDYNNVENDLVQVFEFISSVSKSLFVIENFQYMSADSKKLFQNILNIKLPITFIVSQKGSAADIKQNFNKQSLPRVTMHSIKLQAFTKKTIHDFLNFTFQSALKDSETLAEIMFTSTKGEPFFIKQFLEKIYETNQLFFSNNKWFWKADTSEETIFASFDDTIKRKIKTLHKRDLFLLEFASLFTGSFSISLLSNAAKSSPERLHKIIKSLVQKNIITESSNAFFDGQASQHFEQVDYNFISDQIRQFIIDNISKKRKKRLHERIARYYLSLNKNNHITELTKQLFHCSDAVISKGILSAKAVLKHSLSSQKLSNQEKNYSDALEFHNFSKSIYEQHKLNKRSDLFHIHFYALLPAYQLGKRTAYKDLVQTCSELTTSKDQEAQLLQIQIIPYEMESNKAVIVDYSKKVLKTFSIPLFRYPIGLEIFVEVAKLIFRSALPIFKKKYSNKQLDVILNVFHSLIILHADSNNHIMLFTLKIKNLIPDSKIPKSLMFISKGNTFIKGLDSDNAILEYNKALALLGKERLAPLTHIAQWLVLFQIDALLLPFSEYSKRLNINFFKHLNTKDKHMCHASYSFYFFEQLFCGVPIQTMSDDYAFNNKKFMETFPVKDAFFHNFATFHYEILDFFQNDNSKKLESLFHEKVLNFPVLSVTKTTYYCVITCALFLMGHYKLALKISDQLPKKERNFMISSAYAHLLFYRALSLFHLHETNNYDCKKAQKELHNSLEALAPTQTLTQNSYSIKHLIIQAVSLTFNNRKFDAILMFKKAKAAAQEKKLAYLEALSTDCLCQLTQDIANSDTFTINALSVSTSYDNWGLTKKKELFLKKYQDKINYQLLDAKQSDMQHTQHFSIQKVIELSTLISKKNSIQDFHKAILKICSNIIQASISYIASVDKQELTVNYSYDGQKNSITKSGSTHNPNSMNVMNKVLFSNKEHIQLLCPKLDLDIEFDYNPLNSTNIICVPLFISSSKTPVALLYFENTLSSQQALENCLAQFKEFITFITTLLENFYLFEQNEQLITNLEQKVDEQVEKVRKADQLKKQSEELLEKSSEQSAYATLTRGIAHEIRNPLGMILSGVEILTENLDDREKTMQYLKALKDNILRLSNVTNNMLRFGNPVSKEIKAINLNQIIDSALLLAKGEFKKRNIKIARDLRPVPSVYLDESSISQVILNIILNSIQAIDSNGKITITSSVEQLSTDEGDHSIMLIIHDTGKGISEENLTKIFDPFFTTKYGCTGLGLSTILSIITKYDGNISVDSVENEFTEITITFPVSKLTKKPEPAQTSNTTQ